MIHVPSNKEWTGENAGGVISVSNGHKNARYENVSCVKPYIMSDVQIIVIRLGLEPKTHTLKVYCSTS